MWFRPGVLIARRNVASRARRVNIAYPLYVVRDDTQFFAGYRPAGTTFKLASGRRGGPRDHIVLEWDGGYEDHTYPESFLELHRPGDAHSVYEFRRPSGEPDRWYVNLEAPWRRTPIGFDSRDLLLDIVIDADLSGWRWKDEDELASAVAAGTISAEHSNEIREEGLRAIGRLERRESPFGDGWERWQPDTTFAQPISLPTGWQELEPRQEITAESSSTGIGNANDSGRATT